MALCNIVGDLGYLGFAFASDYFVSLPKLAGASFTLLAHLILLAYGDDQARIIAKERGSFARIILRLRVLAQAIMAYMPAVFQRRIHAKPVGIVFSMLAINGIGLSIDALERFQHGAGWAMSAQLALGCLVVLGCSAFAAADFVKGQKAADILVKIAPAILSCASIANAGLAVTTWNPFIVVSTLAFSVSNVAGFFTRIDKAALQSAPS